MKRAKLTLSALVVGAVLGSWGAVAATADDTPEALSILLKKPLNVGKSASLPYEGQLKPQYQTSHRSIKEQAALERHRLNRYYTLDVKGKSAEEIEEIITKLSEHSLVELVEPEPKVVALDDDDSEMVLVSPMARSVPDYSDKQNYTQPFTYTDDEFKLGGVNSIAARSYPGGKGDFSRVISSEVSHWYYDHIDLPKPFLQHWEIPDHKIGAHDTSSVGIMGAKDNGFGVTGIAPSAQFGYSKYSIQGLVDIAKYVKAGDVIQIGVQVLVACPPEIQVEKCYTPIELGANARDAIRYLTEEKGVHVVMAAGNGDVDLDHPTWKGVFDRNKDTGSIYAGAADPKLGERAYFSDYGSRVDLHAWGRYVTTTSHSEQNPNNYTFTFNGTSAANPIIAGVIAQIQSIAFAHGLGAIPPKKMRELLVSTGNPLPNADPAKPIGVQPDVMAALKELLKDQVIDDTPEAVISSNMEQVIGQGKVTLSGDKSSSLSDGELSYQWRQLSGPEAVMSSTQEKNIDVELPAVEQKTSFIMELTVTNETNGKSAATTFNVIAHPTDSQGTSIVSEKSNSNACMAIQGGILTSAECNESDYTQRWYLNGQDALINAASQQCLQAEEVLRSSAKLASCEEASRWNYDSKTRVFTLQGAGKLALDLSSTGAVVLHDFHGQSNQRWKGVSQAELPVYPEGSKLLSVGNGECVVNQSATVGTERCETGRDQQNWFIDQLGLIHSVSDNSCLIASSLAGETVELGECRKASSWTYAGMGKMIVLADKSDLALTVDERGNLSVAKAEDTLQQKWDGLVYHEADEESEKPNTPPTAVAKATPSVLTGAGKVTLSAKESVDEDGDALSYAWQQVAGPTVELTNSSSVESTVSLPAVKAETIYRFQVTVTDSNSESSSAEVVVTQKPTANTPPKAVAKATPAVLTGAGKVTLSAKGSIDEDGDKLTYAWQQVAGPKVKLTNANRVESTVSLPEVKAETVYRFQVTVTDSHSASSSAEVVVTQKTTANTPPKAAAKATPAVLTGAGSVTLSAEESVDEDGDKLSYAWQQVAGPNVQLTNANSVKSTVSLPAVKAETVYRFKVTVTDPKSASSSAEVVVTQKPVANTPPTAVAKASPSVLTGAGSVTLSAADSYDKEGDTLSYAWQQVAGPNVQLTNANSVKSTVSLPAVKAETVYRFKVTVTDSHSASSSAEVVVTQKPVANTPPTAVAKASPSVLTGAGNVTLSAADSYDKDGDTLSYAWQQIAGPKVQLTNANSVKSTVSLPAVKAETIYRFKVTVTDSKSASSSAEVEVTQKPEVSSGAEPWDSKKVYDTACTVVSYDGKEWLNGWWSQNNKPGSDGEWGVWRLRGASNMHSGCN